MAKAKVEAPLELYYDFLFQEKAKWSGYGIPVSFLDPKTKYIVEGLLYSPKKRAPGAIIKVNVWYTFDSPFIQQPVVVPVDHIFQSRRRITKVNMETVSEEATTVVPNAKPVSGKPIALQDVIKVFEAYKGVNWTIPELSSILERPDTDWEVIKNLPVLGKVSKRICRITNQLEDTYTIQTPEPIVAEDKSKQSIATLEKEYKNCKRCSLSDTRIKLGCNVTFGRGNKVNPKVFIIGEAPGTTERDTGIPFNPSAPAGETLFRVMNRAGLNQDTDCYITNSVWCWPPAEDDNPSKNGKPGDDHLSLCSSRLKTELAILKPKVIVLLGAVAYKAFFGRFLKGPIGNALGWLPVTGDYSVYMMYHPSYIIRQLNFERDPDKKDLIKQDYLERFIEVKNKADEYARLKQLTTN